MIKKNQVYTVSILDLNNLGFGVCKIDGMSVFVSDTVTGDEAEIKIIKTAKTYAVGTRVRLITPSPLRCAAEECCPSAKRCGGCVYQSVTYAHELALKRNYVAFAMKKAGADGIAVSDVLSTGKKDGYRNKAQYPVGCGKDGRLFCGFYAAKTHDIIPAAVCALEPPVFSDICRFVCAFCDSHKITAYDEVTGRGLLRHIYLRTAQATGEILLCLVLNGASLPCEKEFCRAVTERFPDVVSIQISENTKNTNVVMGESCTVLWGKPYIEDILCGLHFRISPLSFYQVNHDGAELLYKTARELLDLRPGETLLDLYCGIGTIGLSVAAGFGDARNAQNRLIGIEIVPEAVENARENARLNGIANASFFCGDASDAQEILAHESIRSDGNIRADAVIVDPPRKGLTPEVISYISALSPSRVVYISCDADTLARDLVRFRAAGYDTDRAQPVDMFSRTGHVETVVLMSRIYM